MKMDSIEGKFLQIYNRQGHYSASQSLSNVIGDCLMSVVRCLHCVLCCKCAACCTMKVGVDSRPFAIGLTRFFAAVILITIGYFCLLSVNELVSGADEVIQKAGWLVPAGKVPPLPR